MYNNQLDFSAPENDYFVFSNIEHTSDNEYENENNNQQIESQNEINYEAYEYNKSPQFEEQLNYINKNDIDLFPLMKPTPLIYNSQNKIKIQNKLIKKKKF